MEQLYSVQSGDLDAFIANHLQPSEEFSRNINDVVHRICTFLKEQCALEARVIKTVKGGSTGKGTALGDNSDADLVVFLSCFSSYQDQAEKRMSVIRNIEEKLKYCKRSIAFNIDFPIINPKARSLSLIFQSKKKKAAIEVDILPAYDVLGQITSEYKPPPQVYLELIQANGTPGEFNTSFTELQRNFVKHCPAKLKGLLRLVKHWYKELKKHLKQTNPSSTLPPKFALELLTIYAWEEGKRRAEQFNTAEGFCTVMKLLTRYEELCIYWTAYYSLEHPTIGAHVKKMLKGPRPVIVDPADPTQNVAKGNGWPLLAREASSCLDQSCCKKGGLPIKPWDVQPARAIQVTLQELTGVRRMVTYSPYTTIGQIKEDIGRELRVSIYELALALALQDPHQEAIHLQNDKALANYGVFYNTTILLLQTKPQEIEIFVKDHNGRSSVYAILPNETVLNLKKKIEARTSVLVNQQRLTYNDRELEDTNTFAFYNIRAKDTVYLLLRVRGGHALF
ncbi:2'-5'-oligoadenylate synthase 1-like [Elgaria multicarinata webbii]|uniref:2'-5'-oligoadenylate synthase 1-like n=1 Tax=Elgaria multicarinata webbii TaxID=159646 RepID=UPI002FCD28F9